MFANSHVWAARNPKRDLTNSCVLSNQTMGLIRLKKKLIENNCNKFSTNSIDFSQLKPFFLKHVLI